jgi:plasmid stabilization system protein ParE
MPDALLDLEEGFSFYERQGAGLGRYFLDSLFADIDSLLQTGGIHRIVYGRYRKLAKRFPFAIYYAIANGRLEVWRVLDCRQNPARITRKLKPR